MANVATPRRVPVISSPVKKDGSGGGQIERLCGSGLVASSPMAEQESRKEEKKLI